jgi:hypothetical protein
MSEKKQSLHTYIYKSNYFLQINNIIYEINSRWIVKIYTPVTNTS